MQMPLCNSACCARAVDDIVETGKLPEAQGIIWDFGFSDACCDSVCNSANLIATAASIPHRYSMGRTGKLGGFHFNISEVLQMASSPAMYPRSQTHHPKSCDDGTMRLLRQRFSALRRPAWSMQGLRCLDWLRTCNKPR